MSEARTQELNFLAKPVIVVAIAPVVVGSLWYGLTFKAIERFWRDLIERLEGPIRLRFVLQPTMAAITALRDGPKDARSGCAPYFMTVLSNPQEQVGLLNEAQNATARIIAIGLGMDVIY